MQEVRGSDLHHRSGPTRACIGRPQGKSGFSHPAPGANSTCNTDNLRIDPNAKLLLFLLPYFPLAVGPKEACAREENPCVA